MKKGKVVVHGQRCRCLKFKKEESKVVLVVEELFQTKFVLLKISDF